MVVKDIWVCCWLLPVFWRNVTTLVAIFWVRCSLQKKTLSIVSFWCFITELKSRGSTGMLADICSAFLKCLSENRELLPDVELLLEATQKIQPASRTPVHTLLLMMMLVSSVSNNPTTALSQQILDVAVLYFKQFQVKICFLLEILEVVLSSL
jgi:hypothetical protein